MQCRNLSHKWATNALCYDVKQILSIRTQIKWPDHTHSRHSSEDLSAIHKFFSDDLGIKTDGPTKSFGRHLGRTAALRRDLPIISVPMDPLMRACYRELEDAIRKALKQHRGNRSVLSTMLNTLLLYPDHPYGLGRLYGTEFDPELKRKVRFLIAETRDLPQDQLYAKERKWHRPNYLVARQN